jgi:DNA repair protein RecO (recombination protein O)
MTSVPCGVWVTATIVEMASARPANDEVAYVLHRRSYGETSLLIDLFARDGGRLRAVARGARRNRVGQPFTELAIAWSGRSALKTLTRAESLPAQPGLLRGRALYAGFYANELLLRLLPEADPHPRLYQTYQCLLEELAVQMGPEDGDVEPSLRRFELGLLGELGYGLCLDRTGRGDAVEAGAEYHFLGDLGLVPAEAGVSPRGEPLRGRDLLAMAADDYRDVQVRRCAKRLLRAALAEQLGPRPLRSRELFRAPTKPGQQKS